jgi:hypothetical protein
MRLELRPQVRRDRDPANAGARLRRSKRPVMVGGLDQLLDHMNRAVQRIDPLAGQPSQLAVPKARSGGE